MSTLPVFTERVLSALGARDALRDAILGDLAEEFAERRAADARDGTARAAGWLARETWRAVPPLLLDGARRLDGRRVLGVAQTLGLTVLCLLVVAAPIGGAWVHLVRTFAVVDPITWLLSLHMLPVLVLAVLESLLAGRLIVVIDPRQPLVSAGVGALLWSLLLAFGAAWDDQFPIWYRVLMPMIVSCGTIGGALLGLRGRDVAD